jgi:hypothetical protein
MMKHVILLVGIALFAACSAGGGTGGTATYRVEFTGSLNAGANFQGTYATQSGQTEVFANALPANKEFTAGASEYVLANGQVGGGGTITVRVLKNAVLCEEKTLNITASGFVSAACNKP